MVDENLFGLVDNFVTNHDTIELTSYLEFQSDSTQISAVGTLFPLQLSDILLLHILIDELYIHLISAYNVEVFPDACWWLYMDPM